MEAKARGSIVIPPDLLTESLADALRKWRALGPGTVQRFTDWQTAPRTDDDGERGGGNGGTTSKDALRDRLEDRQAAAYHAELSTLTNRLDADLRRLVRLIGFAHPDQPRVLHHRDLSATQLAADGWCPSCFRDNGWLEPVAEGRYRDRCRGCGETRGREGRDPSVDELRIMHSRGKSLRQRIA